MANKTKLDLYTNEVPDQYSRDNFKKLNEFLRDQPIFKGHFKFREYTFSTAVTNQRIVHKLTFTPIDAILTYKSDPAVTVTLNQNLWSATEIDITTSGPVSIRLFIGRHEDTNT